MNLLNNIFDDIGDITSFSKEEITEIKEKITKFKLEKAEEPEINSYIQTKLNISTNVLTLYSDYMTEMKSFVDLYLVRLTSNEDSELFFHLKSGILKELNRVIKNLQNFNSNCSNIKRIIKNGKNFIENVVSDIKSLLHRSNDLASIVINSLKEVKNRSVDQIYLWTEINKIKSLMFKLNDLPYSLEVWDEIKELEKFVISLNEADTRKFKKNKKEKTLIFHFNEIYEFFLSKNEARIKIYTDLIYLLNRNNAFEIYQGEEFINILERKEVIQNLKKFLGPLAKEIITDNLGNVLVEIQDYHLKEKKEKFDLDTLKEEKISNFLPKIVDSYIKCLEMKFQEKIHDVTESEEFEEIASFYYKKIDEFSGIFDNIENWILNIENYLKPYDSTTQGLKKILANLTSEIFRRKNEYLTFIKTVKDEELRVNIRKFVNDKINYINDLVRRYEDETSVLIKEEFPQLKKIREILNAYDSKIQVVKDDVYKKLDSMKSHDIDIYQIIKLWEDNFNRKRQQLTFLISLLINKLFKSFKELLDKEGILFATITEITEQTDNFEELPLNFALSAFLAEKLTEDELRERISEINSKVNQLNNSLGLYQIELSKLEKILANRVKIRKGISDSDVQCTVCHKYINFAKDKVITCPFCGSTYHYLCVAFWLSKYNSCPMCQNHFLEPHSELFEGQEDQELEKY
ncbi:MAG: hypothetical protein ACXABO_10885 [Promethearchaeota archaeon]|jgi:hypothetical protein